MFMIHKTCMQGNERSGSDKLKENEKVTPVVLLMEAKQSALTKTAETLLDFLSEEET